MEEKKLVLIIIGNQKLKKKLTTSTSLLEIRHQLQINDDYEFIEEEDICIDQQDEGEITIRDIASEDNLKIRVAQKNSINSFSFSSNLSTTSLESEIMTQKSYNKKYSITANKFINDQSIAYFNQKIGKIANNNDKKMTKLINGSIFYSAIDNLTLYLYPSIRIEDLNSYQKNQLKTIMVIGQTGSGKTTMLDAIVNFMTGVQYEDNFRYKLVDERSIIKDQGNDGTESITSSVNHYVILPGPNCKFQYPLLVIDTPGFMDTRGIERDNQITKQLSQYFKNQIEVIHAVCLVSISSNARLTCSQKYVFEKILEIFGKDIEDNIANLFTFCDGGKSQVLQSIIKEGIPSKFHYKFNNSALYSKSQNGGYVDDDGDDDDTGNQAYMESMYWQMGIKSLEKFFRDVEDKFKPKSLKLTKNVLEEREQLDYIVTTIRPRLDEGLNKLENARKEIEYINKYKNLINENKNFQYTISETRFKKTDLKPGIHTTTCIDCNRTCHDNCAFKNDSEKAKCVAMNKSGYCTICPKKCYWNKHSNQPFKFEYYDVQTQKTSDELFQKYSQAQSDLKKGDQILQGIKSNFRKIMQQVYNDMETLRKSMQELNRIALRPNAYSSLDLIELMIEQEKMNKKPGYLDRIKALNDVMEKFKLLNKLKTEKERKQYLENFFKGYESTIQQLDVNVQGLKYNQKNNVCTII